MIETQLAQIAVVIPSYEKNRIPEKPKGTIKNPISSNCCCYPII
jgi:hypothetical protein